jgi:hypothetical protein
MWHWGSLHVIDAPRSERSTRAQLLAQQKILERVNLGDE